MTFIQLLLVLGLLTTYGDAGAGIDPDGAPRVYADEGPGLCPFGRMSRADEGNGFDPHGSPRSSSNGDRGAGLDPNG